MISAAGRPAECLACMLEREKDCCDVLVVDRE